MPTKHSAKKQESTDLNSDTIVDTKTFALLFALQPGDLRKSPLKDVLTDTKTGVDYYRLIPAIGAMVTHLVETTIPEGEGALNTKEGVDLQIKLLDYNKKKRADEKDDGLVLDRSEAQIGWAKALGQILQAHEEFFAEIIEDTQAPPDLKHDLSVKNADFRNRLASENWLSDLLGSEAETDEKVS